MNALGDVHFIRPLVLLALIPAAWLWWWTRAHTDPLRGWRGQIEPELLRALTVGRSERTRGLGLLLAWMLALLAIAGPTWRLEPSPFADDAAPLMILLRADASLDDATLTAAHLARARAEIADLAAERAGQPLGLIAYAGSAHLVLPPTRDTAIVAQLAAEIEPAIMPVAGDRLDQALALAARVLAQERGSVVVIADRVATDRALLESGATRDALPVQFLALEAEDPSLNDAAAILDADVEPASAGTDDTRAIVRRAALQASAQQGSSARWQESGYWLVPLLGMLVALSFRRTDSPLSRERERGGGEGPVST